MEQLDGFQEQVRQALAHLYDLEALRKSPLVDSLRLDRTPNPATALRIALEKSIEALHPAMGEPPTSKAWRHYHILYYCYVEQLTQAAVADRLGITARHLRREQSTALRVLASYLRAHHGLLEFAPVSSSNTEADGVALGDAEVNRELLWVADSQGNRTAEVERVSCEAIRLVQALAERSAVILDAIMPAGLPPVAMADTVLKQVLLNLLTAAISSVPGGKVTVTARHDGQGSVEIDVAVVVATGQGTCGPWPETNLRLARQLVELFRGQLLVGNFGGAPSARVRLRQADQVVVLAIEDNEDTLQLWQRFVRNTRFQVVGATDPEKAIDMANGLQPDLIILDVMLPDVDGWEVLSRLQHHPATSSIPIVICTVLPQEELARSLGAAGFIRKPVMGRQFRAELERQIAAREQL